MWKWRWTRGAASPGRGASSDEGRLLLEQEAQRLRLDLQERDQTLAELRRQVARLRQAETVRSDQAARAQMERLIVAMATRITQLSTQAHLMDVEGKPVAARDVMANARGLVRILEDEGMTLDGGPGERVPFDPTLHEPLEAGVDIRPGEPVIIRLSGVAFRGRSLRKAGVLRLESPPCP